MSANSQGVKPRIVRFLTGLFRKPEANGAHDPQMTAGQSVSTPKTGSAAPVRSAQTGGYAGSKNGNGIHIPLQAIISVLPLELRAKATQSEIGNVTVPVALDKILSQLAQGAVKIPFGQIRQAAPHVFLPGADSDTIAVVLPLGEILARLNPALLVRHPMQKQVEVPTDITSPFDAGGRGLVLSERNVRPVTPVTPRQVVPAPPAAPITPARKSIAAVPAPTPPLAAAPPGPVFQPAAPIRPLSPLPSLSVPPAVQRPIKPISPLPPQRPIFQPASVVPPAARAAQPSPVPPESAGLAKPAAELPSLSVALTALADGWPEALRQEIVQLNLSETRVALPSELVEIALKRGRVAFAWKVLRSWIRPAPLPTVSAHDATELELPLRVIAPLFLARQNAAAKHQQVVAVDEAIPNLFFGFPKSEAASAPPIAAAPVVKPSDTNYYVWDDTSENARVDETEFKRKPPTGTDFVTRYATPNEIVSRAAALDGVAGALIALPDGLMVASQIPPELNGDTLAAFLPQIFAKVSQATKELRMGELNNLNFTVGNVPWKVFRVNAIFFATFGRAGEPLPTAQLAALAAEMDRKKSN